MDSGFRQNEVLEKIFKKKYSINMAGVRRGRLTLQAILKGAGLKSDLL